METRPNDISGKKNKPRLTDKERSSAESIPSGSSNKQELGKSHLEETQKERYTKELDKIRIGKMTPMETLLPGERQRVGKNQTKCKEDALERTLTSYTKNHPSVHDQLSETAKIIRSLRNLLACDSLATEKARAEADSLFNISKSLDEPGGATVADFLVDVDVPELLTEVIRSLYQKYPNVFSSEEQTNSEVKCAVDVIYSIFRVILTFSDYGKFCEACGQAGVVQECFKLLEGLKMCTDDLSDTRAILEGPEGTGNRFSTIRNVRLGVLAVIHNLSKSIDNKKYFDSCDAVETLLSFYQTQIPEYRATALLCLDNLVHEMNNDLIKPTEELINDLLTMLKGACNSDDRHFQGCSATEIAQGLIYVASNDGNKKRIGQLGGISVLAAMLKDETHLQERRGAVNALYVLSFDEENKDIIKADSDMMDVLQNLQHSDDKEIQRAASGVIWEIAGKEEHKTKSSDSEEHIMISYQWDCQKTMLLLKTELESKGFRVWMDVDKMTGDTLETMARAVEKSSVVLMAMSRKYQSRPNCRSEASYAYKLGKKIIPLMMEENYTPDGWLGLILATKLYMHFEKDTQEGIQQLLKEVTNVTAAESAQSEVLSTPSPMQEANKRVLSSQKEDVAKWLESIGFDVVDNEVKGKLDGRLLCKLDELRKELSLREATKRQQEDNEDDDSEDK